MATIKFLEAGTDATFGTQFYAIADAGATSDSSLSKTGPRSLKFTSTAGGGAATVKTALGVVGNAGRRISVYVNFTDLPTGTLRFISIETGAASSAFTISITSGGVLKVLNNTGTELGSGSTLSTGVWYRIGVSYTISSTSVNEIRVYRDAALDISVTNGSVSNTASTTLKLGWITSSVGNSKILNMDDIYVDDGADLTDTGDVHVTAKLPATNNTNNFDTAIGANPANRYTNVNERALSETNGWQHAANTVVAENYLVETRSTGDVDLTNCTLLGRTAWVWAKKAVAFSTIAYVASAKNTSKVVGTTLAATVPVGGFASGTTVYCSFASQDTTGSFTIADTRSNTWTFVNDRTYTTGFQTPALATSAKNQSKSAGTTLAATVPLAGFAEGTSVIVTFASDDAAGTYSCADTAGNTYVEDVSVTNASHVRTRIFSAHNIAALVSGNSVTVTHPSLTARAIVVGNFTGLEPVGAFDKNASSTGNGTTPDSTNTAATAQTDELLIGAIGVEGPLGDAWTKDANYTNIDRNGTTTGGAATNITIAAEYRVVTAAGTYNATGTITSAQWAAAIATYKAHKTAVRIETFVAYNIATTLQSGDTVTVTHPSTTLARAILISNFSGLDTSSLDKSATATGSSTAPSSGNTAATTQADELLYTAIASEGPSGDTFTVGTSYTAIDKAGTTGGQTYSNITLNGEYRIVSATGTYPGDGTLGTSRPWLANVDTYKALAAAAGSFKLTDNGSDVAVTLLTTSAIFTNLTTSATYPSNAYGMKSGGTGEDTFFYEGGVIIAYLTYPEGYASWANQPISQPPLNTTEIVSV